MIDLENVKQEFIEHYEGELQYLEEFTNTPSLQRKCEMLYNYALSSPIGYDEYICWSKDGVVRVKRKFNTLNYSLYAYVDLYNNLNDEQPLFFDLVR